MKKGLSALSRAVIDDLKDRKQEELDGLGYSCCRLQRLNPSSDVGQAIFDGMRMLGRE